MSVGLSAEQKALETRRNKLQGERRALNEEINQSQKTSAEMKARIKEFDDMIQALRKRAPKGIVVSEHAMLRFLERVDDLDLQVLQDRILTEKNKEVIDRFGTCKINTEDNVTLIVKDHVVVTVDERR